MPVSCYQVVDHTIEEAKGHLRVHVKTKTLGAKNTNIDDVLGRVSSKVVTPPWMTPPWETHGTSFQLFGADRGTVDMILQAHRSPRLTAMTDCDLSVNLDFYRAPVPQTPPDGWSPTTIGKLVVRAKYEGSIDSARRLAVIASHYVAAHPLLRALGRVAVVPPTTQSGVASTEA